MNAKDIISRESANMGELPLKTVSASASVIQILPLLLDTPDHRLCVADENGMVGIIDETSLLNSLNSIISPRDDSSIIEIEVAPADYSASRIARAVEDADVHLVDLLTNPGEDDMLRVTLRVRTVDPSAVVNSLERYGFVVTDTFAEENRNLETAFERLLSLNTLLKV